MDDVVDQHSPNGSNNGHLKHNADRPWPHVKSQLAASRDFDDPERQRDQPAVKVTVTGAAVRYGIGRRTVTRYRLASTTILFPVEA